jgi:Protein of unknown function (DUF2865)
MLALLVQPVSVARLQMLLDNRFARIAALSAVLFATATPALAQSLVQRLFGPGGSRTPDYRSDRHRPFGFSSRTNRTNNYSVWEEDHGTYRTVCVRLCDGFYFPISASVRRGRLHHDNRACMRRCDGEARLFYYPTDGGSAETMVDLRGRRYADLPNAFKYRKTLVAGCGCRPAPWSAEAAAMHEGYRAQAAQSAPGDEVGEEEERTRISASVYYAEDQTDEDVGPLVQAPQRAYRQQLPRTPWQRGPRGWRLY